MPPLKSKPKLKPLKERERTDNENNTIEAIENAEEQIWGLFAKWLDKQWNGSVNYPDTFDIRDWANDLQYLQMAKASGIKSETFNKEIDKQIAEAVIDDNETMKTINEEIDAVRTVRGQFQTTEVEGQTVGEESS